MRVSIVNPKRKGKKRKAKGQTRKQRAASLRNLKKARAARKSKAATPRRRKSKRSRKSKGKKKGKKHKRKGRKHKAKKSKGKPWAKGLRAARKALKAKRGGKRKSRKSKRHGKAVRPTMYRGRTRKGKKVLRHSPRSRYARRGYRFNPADAVKGVMPRGVRKYMPDMRGARLDLPHAAGGVIGLFTSAYGGGMARVVVQRYSTNEYVGHAASLLGNIAGTEIPTIVVNYAMKKGKMSVAADKVARGMRIGGYVAMGLNAIIIGLKVTGIAKIPSRFPSSLSPAKELVLSGLGDVDLVAAGVSGMLGGLADSFVSTSDYAGLGDEGLLDAEISALSAYVGGELDDFSGVPTNAAGKMP